MPKGASTCTKKEIVRQLIIYPLLPKLNLPMPTFHPLDQKVFIYVFRFCKRKKKFRDNSNTFSFSEFSLRLINLFEINYTILVQISAPNEPSQLEPSSK